MSIWIVTDREASKVYRVKAPSRKAAFRKWYRSNPEFANDPDDVIDDVLYSGNLEVDIYSADFIELN